MLFGALSEVDEAALEEPLLRPGLRQLKAACVGAARFVVAASFCGGKRFRLGAVVLHRDDVSFVESNHG